MGDYAELMDSLGKTPNDDVEYGLIFEHINSDYYRGISLALSQEYDIVMSPYEVKLKLQEIGIYPDSETKEADLIYDSINI